MIGSCNNKRNKESKKKNNFANIMRIYEPNNQIIIQQSEKMDNFLKEFLIDLFL